MLDIRLIRREPDAVRSALARRDPNAAEAVDRVLELDERWRAVTTELEALVASSWKEATTFGTMTEGPRLNADLMFEDVFKEMPEHLVKQRALMRAERG